jgi:ATP-dependent Lhr-like helicase
MERGNNKSEALQLLAPEVINLIKARGWAELTEIQERSIQPILSGANVLIMAPTGSGKTEAALLPILSEMIKRPVEPVAVIYITPMKALINDLYERIRWWAERLGLKVAKKHGDTPAKERALRLKRVPHILVTTPESLEIDLDWSKKFREYLKNVRWVIVDEIHEFMNSKRGAQLAILLERLADLAKRDIQRIGLSATIGDPEWVLRVLSGSSRRKQVIVNIPKHKEFELKVVYVEEKGDFWTEATKRILEELEPPSLIFVNSRYAAERLKESLELLGVTDVYVHHSSVSPELRQEAERKLREGSLRAVVCTKTLEVGIDVGAIRKVIQFRAPGGVITLLQRVGRSGHALDRRPKGVVVAVGDIDFLEALAEARLTLKGVIEPPILKRMPLDVVAKEIIGMALAGGVKPSDAFRIIKGSPLSDWIDRETFQALLSYLRENGLIKIVKGIIKPAHTFYRIWRFRPQEDQSWWSRDFREFFSTIETNEMFTVKWGEKIIGYIDVNFVYKYLRAEDTIRLAGGTWEIKKIDTNFMRIEVVPSNRIAEIPLWRGEGPRRNFIVAEESTRILSSPGSDGVVTDPNGLKRLERIKEEYVKRGLPVPGPETVIYEYYNGEHIFTAFLGSGANETLALLLTYLISRTYGLNTYYRTSFFGFSVYAPKVDVLGILKSIDPEELPDLVKEAVKRSPHLQNVIRNIQLDLGVIGNPDEERDHMLYEEAVKQVIEDYLDLDTAKRFLSMLREGKVRLRAGALGGLTPLAKEVLEQPTVRPWIQDLSSRIARLLEDNALTIDEIADILELATKTIDNKIRELRKPEAGEQRVVGFIDVDEDEWRWTLLKSLESVVSFDEFKDSFEPKKINEPVKLVVKVNKGDRPRQLLITPKKVIENWDAIENMLPEEMQMVIITHPDWEGAKDDVAVVHHYVPKSALKYLILNAARYIEKKLYFSAF